MSPIFSGILGIERVLVETEEAIFTVVKAEVDSVVSFNNKAAALRRIFDADSVKTRLAQCNFSYEPSLDWGYGHFDLNGLFDILIFETPSEKNLKNLSENKLFEDANLLIELMCGMVRLDHAASVKLISLRDRRKAFTANEALRFLTTPRLVFSPYLSVTLIRRAYGISEYIPDSWVARMYVDYVPQSYREWYLAQ